ncbi:MAG: MBL fold metallo-hydrolase [Chloroflexi bacterium]|nr:MBL fold metallo-hydrolase [Chloroflexota bacterium]MBU1748539.1 MBL fold metallo-hydrolase [Chloroflexota bacterium]
MSIHFLNCFTCNARAPLDWRSGTLCLLVETDQGPVLVDTGLGQDDYIHQTSILRIFQVITIVPLNPQEAAVRQVAHLGYQPEDVRHIVLTHMHFDHCGGLPDFPHATIHVHRREYEAFAGRPRRWTDLGYVRRHIAHQPEFVLYDDTGSSWLGLTATRLPFEPAMWLVPLFGHTRGHCGVAVQTESGWLFHVGDAAPIDLGEYAPGWLVRVALGPHAPRLREFGAAHTRVRMTTGHMWLDFFEQGAE